MKLNKAICLLSIMLLALLCISCVSAAEPDNNSTDFNDNDSVDSESTVLENSSDDDVATEDTSTAAQSTNATQKQTSKVKKIEPYVLCEQGFIHKKSNAYKVKVFDYTNNHKIKYIKNLKLTVKVKIGKKTKTYNVKTNSKGEAKILNVKNLKVGVYKVTVTTTNKNYNIKSKGNFVIYGKAKKSTTIKMKKTKYGLESRKKLGKNDVLWTFYEPKDAQNSKGVYATTYDPRNPLDKYPNSMITQAKFFFKNKKTGKIISKTSKLTKDKFYGWKNIKVNPIKGYVPIKTKVWYQTL